MPTAWLSFDRRSAATFRSGLFLVAIQTGRSAQFLAQRRLGSNQLSFVPGYPPGGGEQKIGIVLHGRTPLVAEEDDLALRAGRL